MFKLIFIRSKTPISRCGLSALFVIVAYAQDCNAGDWLQLDPLEWRMIFEFDGSRRDGGAGLVEDRRFDEGILLRQRGSSLDPRIANFLLEVQPTWSQADYQSVGNDDELDGLFMNYNAGLNLLSGTPDPLSVNLHSAQTDSTSDFNLGNRSEFRAQTNSVALSLKTPAFPTTFSYTQRSLDQSFHSGFSSVVTERDDILDSFVIQGRSSKSRLYIGHEEFDDRLFNRDFSADKLRLFHTARWGKASRLSSSVDYIDRSDYLAYQRLDVAESVRLQHLENLSSSYRYRYSSLEKTSKTRSNTLNMGLNHRLYQNLSTSLDLSGANSDFDLGTEDEYGAKLNLNYTKRLGVYNKPGPGKEIIAKQTTGPRLSAGIGGGRHYNDREATAGALEVVDESHVADQSRNIVLNERYIDLATVVITDVNGLVVYGVGSDYTLAAVANDFTEVTILPGGQISTGDTILVDYSYQALPSLKYETDSYRYHMKLDFASASLYHRGSGWDQDLVSGSGGGFLTDREDSTTGGEWRWKRRLSRATLGVEQRHNRSGSYKYDSLVFKQTLFHTLSPSSSMTISAYQNRLDSSSQETKLDSLDASIRWRPLFNLIVTPRLGAWRREEIGVSTQRFVNAGFDLRWSIRKLTITANYTHNHWGGTGVDDDEDRLMLTVVRVSQ